MLFSELEKQSPKIKPDTSDQDNLNPGWHDTDTFSPKYVEKITPSHTDIASCYEFPFSFMHNCTPPQCYKGAFAENFTPNTISSL